MRKLLPLTLTLSCALFLGADGDMTTSTVAKIEIYRPASYADGVSLEPETIRTIDAQELKCPKEWNGYLVTVIDDVAFVLATREIPVEYSGRAAKLATDFILHVPNGQYLYSAYYRIADDRTYWTAALQPKNKRPPRVHCARDLESRPQIHGVARKEKKEG